ncbi:recombinase family protein [Conexibacter arvalis]|uniref:DNA invertase Pin-like site-specific DNA recombinase n=1 Tax=Conexibacter arvalis TaxID=912552 RepID=A0A840IAA7_9ACTN|nr:recombinase family protein [Conexibacter arvalis]MBB4661776.1 DNA invertase Pin-like site-specific DNA recombinase [Conexibacter arvalis]
MSVIVSPTPIAPATVRYAFYGRVSTEDQQDPSLSIPRQLAACERVVREVGGTIVAFYWDIESGRKELLTRGRGANSTPFGVPVRRDGGIADLRADASKGRSFDAVIVESIDRLSRMTADATGIERELEHLDIGLFASDEPMVANATAILTRRVKQGVAEWYVCDLMEKSRRGMEKSVKQGWHTGGPVPYGYTLEPHRHPNPHKAREGKKKHRLVPDPERAPIVLMIFSWYVVRKLGIGEICDRLNRDLDRYPPPQRNRKDDNDLPQTWSKAQIQSMLRNPKYTGFNVWNRHDKRRGRPLIRPKEQWAWSAEPAHEPIVPRELFDEVDGRARRNTIQPGRRAQVEYPQRTGRRAGRLYPLRGRVRCARCGRRMEGSHQRHANWYRCRFVWTRGGIAADRAGHPRALGIRESDILDHLIDFMGRQLFGPERLRLLRKQLVGRRRAARRARRAGAGAAQRARTGRPRSLPADASPRRARRPPPPRRRGRQGADRGAEQPPRRDRRRARRARRTASRRSRSRRDRGDARRHPGPTADAPRSRPRGACRDLRGVRRERRLRQAQSDADARGYDHAGAGPGKTKSPTAERAGRGFRI